jgi:glycosyltransferase involved in cell wall biosynthesis
LRIGIDARVLLRKSGGLHRYLNNLLTNLVEIDKENEYSLYVDRLHSEIDFLNKEGKIREVLVKTLRLYDAHEFNSVFWNNLLLPSALIREKIDIFHSPIFILPLLMTPNSVVTIHDISFDLFPNYSSPYSIAENNYLKIVVRLSARKARRIIVPTKSVKNDIIQTYKEPPGKIEVTYLAADDIFSPINKEMAKEEVRRKFFINDFILFVGLIQPRRNIVRLIKAFYFLKKYKKFKHKLVLIGSIADRNVPNLIEELNLSKYVYHLNYISNNDLLFFYNAADLLIYPSLYEGFALPLVEAMACGTPVITSNVSCMPEVVGNAGMTINTYSVDEIAWAIDHVVNNEELKKNMEKEGIKRSKIFSWRRLAEETLAVYQETYR